MNVPYFDMTARLAPLRRELIACFEKNLDRNSFCLGPDVKAFENDFADFVGAAECIALSSGTAALHIALRCLDIGPGDEVITCPMTFAATCWAISYVGAKPVFVDAHPDYCTLDPSRLEAAITSRTKAVIPVHLYGQPADMDAIHDVCERHGIPVVEDAAQAHGALYKGNRLGSSSSAIICYSFYPGKNLGALGEGGAVVCNDPKAADRARCLREHGSREKYRHEEVGFNYRMDGIQGACLGVLLKHVEKWNEKRRELAARYNELLAASPLTLPREAPYSRHTWHIYSIRTDRRDQLKTYLDRIGVGCGLHYPIPMHLQPCYRMWGHEKGSFPVSEAIGDCCLSLPMFPEMTQEQQEFVIGSVKEFFA